jgi:predicted Zn-ribbon and HTH transcriptional regulator
MSDNNTKACEFCAYRWIAKVSKPKSCPRCKRRFDYKEAKIFLESLGKEYGYDLIGGVD